ncbi:MAG: hypothetical protein JXX28_11515 [Deltaproteobacteria bacterium]|nr:hypothetical protein [Deltaproteobacteria bacterium]
MRVTLLITLALALTACRKDRDEDADGYSDNVDCDDQNAEINPGVEEVCDGVDNNCDGLIDLNAVDAVTFFGDADGDGHGNPQVSQTSCEAPSGYVDEDDDCDDTAANIHPGASEDDCTDPVDYNCDGSVGYADADADGFPACQDCDDAESSVNPNALEVCDEIDNNCDGNVNEAGAIGAVEWFADGDEDSFGDPSQSLLACDKPEGYVENARDCDDSSDAVRPGAPELCNQSDDNCNDMVDEDPTDAPTWYLDADGDLAGNPRIRLDACLAPEGYVADSSDCDDLNPHSFPGAAERCDGLDNDCDSVLPSDEADQDADGVMACDGDCDDSAPSILPGAPESCNGLDDNCNGLVDDNPVDMPTWYADADEDGHGDPFGGRQSCQAPEGYVSSHDDCDDRNAATLPGAAEICDGFDNNCDRALPPDEADQDGDGFIACDDDCDDADPSVHPGAPERCNGADDDCDGATDNDAVDEAVFYPDADGDGRGVVYGVVQACSAPAGFAALAGDCDDTNPLIYTGAPQRCDGIANDCSSPLPADEADGDADGQRICAGDCDDTNPLIYTGAPQLCDGVANACGTPLPDDEADLDADGYRLCDLDCDDGDATIHPGVQEVPGDGIDSDCDGWNPPMLVIGVAENEGEVYAVDYLTGALVWTHTGLDRLRDAATSPDGTVYVSDASDGVVALTPDGLTATPVVSGYSEVYGLWWDQDTGTLLFTSVEGTIGEYDPSSGVAVELATGLTGAPYQTVRFVGSDVLYTTFAGDQNIQYLDPAVGSWEVFADLGFEATSLIPAQDGGFWVGGGGDELIAHVDRYGVGVTRYDVGEIVPGACEAPVPDDSLVFADMSGALRTFAGGSTASLISGLQNPFGCGSNSLADWDGDGYVGVALGGEDCDDSDPLISPDAVDTFGTGVDENCDFVDGNDADGDGIPVDHSLPECQDQDDSDPAVGFLPECIQASCAETLAVRGPGTPSGYYDIDPDGGDPANAYPVYCEMSDNGGGWERCLSFTNTSAEDMNNNTWFNGCITATQASHTGSAVMVRLKNTSGTTLYSQWGTRSYSWSQNVLTSTAAAGSQYHSGNHSRLVTLGNGDKLFLASQFSTQSGCGGSFGNGYGLVVYPSSPNYHSNPKMIVMPYRHQVGYTGTRGFTGWTTSHEISGTGNTSFDSCVSTPAQLGTFEFFVR